MEKGDGCEAVEDGVSGLGDYGALLHQRAEFARAPDALGDLEKEPLEMRWVLVDGNGFRKLVGELKTKVVLEERVVSVSSVIFGDAFEAERLVGSQSVRRAILRSRSVLHVGVRGAWGALPLKTPLLLVCSVHGASRKACTGLYVRRAK